MGLELVHASEHHGHNHCDITAEHFDSHDKNCAHLHFLSKVNAIDFSFIDEICDTDFIEHQIFHYQSENTALTYLTHGKRGPPFLLFS